MRVFGPWLFASTVMIVSAGCKSRPKTTDPVGTLKRFMAAVENGDSKGVWKHLGPRTRTRLNRSAKLATAQTVGTLELKGVDMLSAGARSGAGARWRPKRFKVIEKSKERALVEVSAPEPSYALFDAGRLKLVFAAGPPQSVRPSRKPVGRVHAAWPFIGLVAVGYVFPADSDGRVVVGAKERVLLVRHRGRWRVELSFDDGTGGK